MAKDKNPSKNNSGKQNSDRRGSVAESVKTTEIGRAAKRQARLFQEKRRNNERETGIFHTRVNAERSNDLAAAARGAVGSYAWPGNNEPSLHFNVQPEVGKQGSMPVVRLETIQYGHKLEGSVFDPKIFLPCFYIEKFGTTFRSRLEDHLGARTQELICHYLADQLGYDSISDILEAAPVDTFEDVFNRSNPDMKMMLKGVVGQYGIETEHGQVLLEVFAGKRSNLRVINSTDNRVTGSRAYIPVHCVFQRTLEKVTDEATYAVQLAVYTLIQNELGELIATIQAEQAEERKALREALLELHSATTEAAQEAADQARGGDLGKAGKKQLKKLDDQLRKQREWNAAQTAIENMRKHVIGLREAATGKMDYVEMTNPSGELIVLFGQVGADKVIQVVHIGDRQMLRLAGVDVGTKIYVGQLLHGQIDRIDMENHRLNSEQVKAGNALINYIHDRLGEAGVKLRTPRTNLRLVKKAA